MTTDGDAISTFRVLARDYCDLLEGGLEPEKLSTLQVALSKLLSAGYELPETVPTSERPLDSVGARRRSEVFAATLRLLGQDHYWTVFDPTVEDEPTVGSVADDLTDIWGDLRAGLDALDSGVTLEDVVWQWRFDMQTHWGKHAVEVLRALHDR